MKQKIVLANYFIIIIYTLKIQTSRSAPGSWSRDKEKMLLIIDYLHLT